LRESQRPHWRCRERFAAALRTAAHSARIHKPELNGLDGTISSYDADTRYTISWAFDFTSMCERAARCMCVGQSALCAAAHCVPKKTMVNNEVKTMGAKRKRGRAGQRVTHVTGFHPHISPHYMFDTCIHLRYLLSK